MACATAADAIEMLAAMRTATAEVAMACLRMIFTLWLSTLSARP
jgi:hypothetical protein